MQLHSLLPFLYLQLFISPVTLYAQAFEPTAEPRLTELPPGIVVERSIVVPDKDLELIGNKLGGRIARLSNNFLRVHGRSIQVNLPTEITYEVKAELALIDQADYMSCNPLFLAFLQAE